MQKSINTQRLERNETLGHGLGAGLGCLLVGHSPIVVTATMGTLPYLKEIAAWLITTSPLNWTTFLAGSIPNAIATLAYNTADFQLKNTYTKEALNDSPVFHTIVAYGTSAIFFVASAALIAKISGIAAVTVLGCSTMGWIAKQVIHVACALFLSFDGSQKEISKKLDQLTLSQIKIEKPVKEQAIQPPLVPFDIELWDHLAWVPTQCAEAIAFGIDTFVTEHFGGPSASLTPIHDPNKIDKSPDNKLVPFEEMCPCQRYKAKEPKNLNALAASPSTIKATETEVKGIPNVGNSCYQNSATQVLFNLIDAVGEEHFTFYRILNNPEGFKKERLEQKLAALKFQKTELEQTFPKKEESESYKHHNEKIKSKIFAIEHLEERLKTIVNPVQNEKNDISLKDNSVLMTYLYEEFVKPNSKDKSRNEGIAQIDGDKIKILLEHHLKVLETFIHMRKEYKAKGIKAETSQFFRKAMNDLYFKGQGLTDQRGADDILTPLLNLLGSPVMPFQDIYTYRIIEDNLKKAKKLIEEKIPKKENVEPSKENTDVPSVPLEKDQKYQFEKNIINHPADVLLEKNNLSMFEIKIDDNINSQEPIHLSGLVIKSKDEELDRFRRGERLISERKNVEDDVNLPLVFPADIDCDTKKKPFFDMKKERIQVIQATRTSRLIKGDPIPPFTIINLSRAITCEKHDSKKHHTRVIPDATIELEVLDAEGKVEEKITQELTGACVHPWGSADGGHWISYVYKQGKWYQCDDGDVYEVINVEQMFKQMSVNGTSFTYVTKSKTD